MIFRATAADRDMRDAQRAEGGDEYQKKMFEAAQDFYGTKERNELKMTVARVQSGYRAGGGIRANEIKGFLNIWCNQRRLKPEYEFIERGKPPKAEFSNEPKCCFFAIFGVFLSFGEQVRACKELQNFQRKNRFEN